MFVCVCLSVCHLPLAPSELHGRGPCGTLPPLLASMGHDGVTLQHPPQPNPLFHN